MASKKKQGFVRRARLCLCLFICLGSVSCSIFRSGDQGHELRNYRIIAVGLPGEYPMDLAVALEGAFTQIEPVRIKEQVSDQPVQFCLSVKVSDEAALNGLLARWRSSGLQVSSILQEE